MNAVRSAFLDAFDAAGEVLRRAEVGAAWGGPSALEGFSVRGLAGHLVRAGARVAVYVGKPPPPEPDPVPAPAYFAQVLSGMDAADNERVIRDGEATAQGGWKDLIAAHAELRESLAALLEAEPEDRVVQVFGDLVMRLDDYLETRIVELLVHTDDLAVSIGAGAPPPPQSASDIAIPHLVEVARMRHGDRNVLMALSRRERDEVEALRIF